MPAPRTLPFSLALAGPALAFLSLSAGVGFVGPTLGMLVGSIVLDTLWSAPRDEQPIPDDTSLARALPLAFAPALVAFTLWTAQVFATASGWEKVGLALGAGVYACTFGINVAHELIHARSRFDRGVGGLMCAILLAGSFKVEHIRGHHRDVATDADPSSAPLGRSLYAHLPRAVVGNAVKGWVLESARLRRRGLPWWRHELLGWALVSGGMLALAGWTAGPWGALFVVVQGVLARVNLEIINYVEHYGLRRNKRPSGRYEPVGSAHSWSSEHPVSRIVLLNLPRHADHHAIASRPWVVLQHRPDAPMLPASYPAMFLLAMVPPVWRRVMDPRVQALQADVSLPEEAWAA
jgi:alkane 1-monooxygenase